YFNKVWLEFTGRTREQELGNGWAEGVHPDDLERCLNTYVAAFDAREEFKMEYRLRRFDGEYRWILNNGTPRLLPDGSFAGYIGSCIDINDRKQAEETLKENVIQLYKKKRYEEIISTVTQSVHQSINLQEVLENSVESMKQHIDGVDNISIYFVEGEEAVIKANRGYPEWFIEAVRRIPYPKGFTWKTIIDGKPVYCPDVDQDTTIGPAGRKMGTKSYASMPIHSKGKTVGTININSFQKNAFDEEELKLLEIVARQIEIAINNAQMAEALRKSKDELETRVEERTIELRKTNEQLLAEIAERKRAEERVKTSLREKELLLKEIHHRVKNNLQVISSLLNLQAPHITDEYSQGILLESRNRIRSMALVHEQLYRSYDITQINFHAYLNSLVKDLLLSYSARPDVIKVNLDIQDILFDIDTAIPCGLLINELISNCLRHAFPQGQKGEIYIAIRRREGNRYRLTVQDNGVGFPPELDFQNIKSLGLRLVMALTKQLQGDITLERSNGTTFHIDFATVRYKERE
ncbi:MAG TPA: histidine kinase dimerization/phosphoacceptor domain -containing protein, partial [Thermodesulfobacteriota bacterium]|nr:histidine kinase dimerization/phosphoacceptor domain -containing protein [Thermodesulfobacteriota bacterium]